MEALAVAPSKLLTRDFVLVCVGRVAFFASMTMLLPVLPLYIVSIKGSEAMTGLVVGLFSVSIVVVSPFVGRAADRRPRKGLMLLGSTIFLAASALYNFVLSVPLLCLLRLFHGSGLGYYNVSSSAYAADISPAQRRGEAMGWFGMSNNVAMAVGPALGMAVYQGYGFNAVFIVSAAIAAASLFLTLLVFEPKRVTRRPDGTKPQLFSGAAFFPSALLVSLSLTYGTIVAFVPIFATKNGVENPGLYFTAYAIALIVSRILSGTLSDRFGRAAMAVPGLCLAALSVWLLPVALSLPLLLLSAALYGFSFGAVHPALMALAIDRATPENRGAAMGTFGMAFDLGMGLGSILLGLVLEVGDFTTMFLVTGVLPLFGVAAFGGRLLAAKTRKK